MHAPTHDEHAHPGAGTYVKIAVILFVITALEVGGYEVVRRGSRPASPPPSSPCSWRS